MVFSSPLFVFYFLPLALLTYYALLAVTRRSNSPGLPLRHVALTLLSYLFYGWSNPAFCLLMLLSTGIDYLCGLALVGRLDRRAILGVEDLPRLDPECDRTRAQKWAVTVSVISNLSLLGFFKYFNFAVDSYTALLASLGLDGASADTLLRVTLPLGISFYTFQSMSYTLDVYRGQTAPLARFVDFACYVSMFPQLVAGPIIRFSEVAEQLRERTHTLEKFSRGCAFFSLGMAKKVLLANPCGQIADLVFDAGSVHTLDAWFGLFAYGFQIYFDFSGYSDMAIGLGLMLGFVFPKNFDSPYKARSVTDFWRRWHISLSSWLRDYLYIPLGGNRKGTARTYVNLMLVMLLGGLWHGASWNFVLWGGLHGLFLAIERMLGKSSPLRRWPIAAQVTLTFLLVNLPWVFFRAETLDGALAMLVSLCGLGPLLQGADPQAGATLLAGLLYTPYHLICFSLAALVTFGAPQTWDWTRHLTPTRAFVALLLFALALVSMLSQGYNPFIYFIF